MNTEQEYIDKVNTEINTELANAREFAMDVMMDESDEDFVDSLMLMSDKVIPTDEEMEFIEHERQAWEQNK